MTGSEDLKILDAGRRQPCVSGQSGVREEALFLS